MAETLPRDDLVDARDHHDRAVRLVGAHDARGLARAQEGPGQVDLDHLLPLLERHVDEQEGLLDAGVVDQQVEPAERLAGLGEAALHLGLVADVHLATGTARPPAASMVAAIARASSSLAAMVDGHRGAVSGERERGALADAAGGAGDQRAAALEQSCGGGMQAEVVIGHAHGLPH